MNAPLTVENVATLSKTSAQASAQHSADHRRWQLLVLSAKSQAALEQATDNLLAHLENQRDISLADAAFTLQAGRKLFQHRRMLVCESLDDAVDTLRSRDPQRMLTLSQKPKNSIPAFLFPGQWLQSAEVARQLYPIEPVFRAAFERCAEALRSGSGVELHGVLRSPHAARPAGAKGLLFAVEYSLASLWMGWTGRPAALLGQDTGAYVAACIAAILRLDDGLALTVADAENASAETGLDAFDERVESIELSSPQIPCICGFSGAWLRPSEGGAPQTWPRQQRKGSGFASGVRTLLQAKHDVVLELGPGSCLGELAKQGPNDQQQRPLALAALPASAKLQPAYRALLHTLGKLYLAGTKVDWRAVHGDRRPHRIPLPTYPFERKRCWFSHPVAPPDTAQAPEASALAQPGGVAEAMASAEQPACAQRARSACGSADCGDARDSVEQTLVAICQQLLGIEGIGVYDNIVELGANSLFTLQLSNEVAKIYRLVITPHHLFQEPTIASLATKVRCLLSSHDPAGHREREPRPERRDSEELAEYGRLLDRVERLPDEAVDHLLAGFQKLAP